MCHFGPWTCKREKVPPELVDPCHFELWTCKYKNNIGCMALFCHVTASDRPCMAPFTVTFIIFDIITINGAMHGLPEAATWQNSAMQPVLFLYLHVHGSKWHGSTSSGGTFSCLQVHGPKWHMLTSLGVSFSRLQVHGPKWHRTTS